MGFLNGGLLSIPETEENEGKRGKKCQAERSVAETPFTAVSGSLYYSSHFLREQRSLSTSIRCLALRRCSWKTFHICNAKCRRGILIQKSVISEIVNGFAWFLSLIDLSLITVFIDEVLTKIAVIVNGSWNKSRFSHRYHKKHSRAKNELCLGI